MPMPKSDPKPGGGRPAGGWLSRHPGVVPLLAAASFLGLLQAVVLSWANQAMGWQMALGMGKLGLLAGLVTVLLLTPVVLWLRRRHPRWRRGDPGVTMQNPVTDFDDRLFLLERQVDAAHLAGRNLEGVVYELEPLLRRRGQQQD